MFCHKCGKKLEKDSKFCVGCGVAVTNSGKAKEKIKTVLKDAEPVQNDKKEILSETTIKCGNCDYIGRGESARRIVFTVLAWLCVLFAPLITIIYFVATSKYRCPKCHSTFLGVKNSEGIFVSKGSKGSRGALIFIVVIVAIAIIGILASVVLASLNSARQKARDARRIADIKQMQLGLELYFDSYGSYPSDLSNISQYLSDKVLPKDPSTNEDYGYKITMNSDYHLWAELEKYHSVLDDDADISSGRLSGIDGSKESCTSSVADDCVYDVSPYF